MDIATSGWSRCGVKRLQKRRYYVTFDILHYISLGNKEHKVYFSDLKRKLSLCPYQIDVNNPKTYTSDPISRKI